MVRKNIDGLTTKQRNKKVTERSNGLCEMCFSNHGVQHHHIIGGSGKRTQCESKYSLIALCLECHYGDYGVHGIHGEELNKRLKEDLQRKYEDIGLVGNELKYWLGGKFYIGVD